MQSLTAQQLADILGTTVAAGRADTLVTGGVSTDTRNLPRGAVFFALRGENFDGDGFAAPALDAGAAAVVVSRWTGGAPAAGAVLVVADPLRALQRLAYWWRSQLAIPVVAITGSNGKTSVKDFTAAVLGRRYQVAATRGNLIGVPLSVLATTTDHTAAVWELGMNHPGEIAPLCEIARPKYGIITHIGTAHIEFFGSRNAIAEEKCGLARALPADGILFLPATCDFHEYFRQRTKATLIPVGNGRGLVRAENLHTDADRSCFTLAIEGEGKADVELAVPGRHMVTNALLAAGVAWKLGVPLADIAAGLADARLTAGRLQRRIWNGVTLIDDSYNANPESMAAAIETLADMPLADGARRIIVLGRMGELGNHGPAAHLHVGELAARHHLTVLAVGEGSENIARGAKDALHFPRLEDGAMWLSREVKSGDVVLFKGSRTATVEQVMHTAFPS